MADLTDADEDRQPPSVVLPVTCARDGREHLVVEDEMVPGNAGRYTTLCGHRMLAAVLAGPPGPPCPHCIRVHTATARNRRANRPGIWARLTAWLTPARRKRPRAARPAPAPSPVTVVPLATEVTTILTARRCPPSVLTHPYAPGHWVLLAGEPCGVALSCPPGVHRVTATVLLPPTVTPRGPVTWVHPPQENSLLFCREIDLFGALRTELTKPPSPQG